ncbi:MAG: heme ABC transporter ATP-binding protein [Bacillota bacterium]
MPNLAMRNVSFSYNGTTVLSGISFELGGGTLLSLIGPNGAGKTTLIKIISGILRPETGSVLLDGRDLSCMKQIEVARRMAVVPQHNPMDFGFTVQQVVMMGRYPYLNRLRREGGADFAAVAEAIRATGLGHMAQRPVTSLSGGERQRVAIARALAQQPEILLLDEPTAHLDIACQAATLELLRRLSTERGIAVIAALHDLNLAAAYFDRLILLKEGRIAAQGAPDAVLTPENIQAAYGIGVTICRHPDRNCPQLML